MSLVSDLLTEQVIQRNFGADFGFLSPFKTKANCKNPQFISKNLHRIAIMKDFHVGAKGDVGENGIPGWVSKFVCTGCGKKYTIKFQKGYFHPDSSQLTTL